MQFGLITTRGRIGWVSFVLKCTVFFLLSVLSHEKVQCERTLLKTLHLTFWPFQYSTKLVILFVGTLWDATRQQRSIPHLAKLTVFMIIVHVFEPRWAVRPRPCILTRSNSPWPPFKWCANRRETMIHILEFERRHLESQLRFLWPKACENRSVLQFASRFYFTLNADISRRKSFPPSIYLERLNFTEKWSLWTQSMKPLKVQLTLLQNPSCWWPNFMLTTLSLTEMPLHQLDKDIHYTEYSLPWFYDSHWELRSKKWQANTNSDEQEKGCVTVLRHEHETDAAQPRCSKLPGRSSWVLAASPLVRSRSDDNSAWMLLSKHPRPSTTADLNYLHCLSSQDNKWCQNERNSISNYSNNRSCWTPTPNKEVDIHESNLFLFYAGDNRASGWSGLKMYKSETEMLSCEHFVDARTPRNSLASHSDKVGKPRWVCRCSEGATGKLEIVWFPSEFLGSSVVT